MLQDDYGKGMTAAALARQRGRRELAEVIFAHLPRERTCARVCVCMCARAAHVAICARNSCVHARCQPTLHHERTLVAVGTVVRDGPLHRRALQRGMSGTAT